ncbi:MAG: TetR family transcriptional regulator [Actinomycetes bacterium]
MSRRTYDASRRQESAALTRTAVLDAARSLFVERGYAATTMGAVATQAGVATATAAAAFGGKAALLKQLVNIAIVGDDDPVPVRERQVAADVAATSDAHEQVALLAAFVTEAHGRLADLYDVMQQASGSDADVMADLQGHQQGRHEGMAEFVAHIDPDKLRMDAALAADIVWALTDPRLYTGLVREHGWTAEQYQTWLTEQLSAALLS